MKRRLLHLVLGLLGSMILIYIAVLAYIYFKTKIPNCSDVSNLPNTLWKFTSDDRSPTVQTAEDRVYIGANRTLYSLDHQSGEILWTSDELIENGYISDIFAESDNVVVVLRSNPPGHYNIEFQGLDSGNGGFLWRTQGFIEAIDYGVHPFIATRHVYAGDEDNNLVAIDRNTGAITRSIPLGERVLLYPLSTNELVFYIGPNGNLHATDDATGESVWTANIGKPSLVDGGNRPVYDGYVEDQLLVLWDHSVLQAFDTPTGNLLWINSSIQSIDAPLLYRDGIVYVIQNSSEWIQLDRPNSYDVKNQFTINAINASTGDLYFQRTYEGWDGYPLAVVEDILVVSGQSYIYGLNPLTGEVLWRQSEGSSYYMETVIRRHIGYFAPEEVRGDSMLLWWMNKLKAVDLTSGQELWSVCSCSSGRPYDYIFATEQVLVVQGTDGDVSVFQLEN